MPNKLAMIFPGQGSQYLGMGHDLYQRYPEARAIFDEADEILGFKLSKLCFEGPEPELNDTINTQPAILIMSLAALRALRARHDLGEIAFAAGHSLGEYTALVASGQLSFADGVRLVRERGRLMKEAGERRPGGMAAVLGLAAEAVDDACRQAREETGFVVQVANHNSPEQIVISGEHQGLEMALELIKQKVARRVVTLRVSIASHSPLMESAAQGLRHALSRIAFQQAAVPVVGNVTGKPLGGADDVREELASQLVSPVLWVDSVRYMLDHGTTTFVEIGPKDVLSKLIKRIDWRPARINVGDVTGVEAWHPKGGVQHEHATGG
jgi:[acyl-carrier-protein] S-malonyltransferase